jgi:predicted TIM-barrel fold metal-dependent hydrolase
MALTDTRPEDAPTAYPFKLTDADEHSTPRFGAHSEYMDPDKKDLAITTVRKDDGTFETLYAGRPARMKLKEGSQFQVTFSNEKLDDVGVQGAGGSKEKDEDDDGNRAFRAPVPGSLLNRLNPLKGMDTQQRKDFAKQYRALQPLLDNPADRLNVMDSQGIEAAVNYASIVTEYEFEDNLEALYANQRAENRYLEAEWGFNYQNRLFTPPVVSFADADAALVEVKHLFENEPPKVIQIMAGPSVHRSPFRPECDPIWSILNEAGTNVCTHLSTVTFYGRQGLEWDEEEVMLGDMNAFQWMMYYGDRPAYESVAAAVLQGLFNRFPSVKLLLSEQGTVWMPYIVRKMDHAFLMGRKATWGTLEMRPSEYVRKHVLVAPYPEENVDRVIESVGVEPLAFGSDFPHGEGLPDPALYKAQLKNCNEEQTKAIMRNNLAGFLGLELI